MIPRYTPQTTVPVSLKNGPSKFDLMVALFVGSTALDQHAPVTFVTESGQKLEVQINGISREDGSGESWMFEGAIVALDGKKLAYKAGWSQRVRGYFSTRNRQGHLEELGGDNG